jgi:hypothetical protein
MLHIGDSVCGLTDMHVRVRNERILERDLGRRVLVDSRQAIHMAIAFGLGLWLIAAKFP